MASANDGDRAAAGLLRLLLGMAAGAPAMQRGGGGGGPGVLVVQHLILDGDGDLFSSGVGGGVPPASKAAIAALKEVKAGEVEGGAPLGDCAICLDGVEDAGKEMPCGHRFHGECLERWLGVHGNCPTCRHELPPAKDKEEGSAEAEGGEERRRPRAAFLVSYLVVGGQREEAQQQQRQQEEPEREEPWNIRIEGEPSSLLRGNKTSSQVGRARRAAPPPCSLFSSPPSSPMDGPRWTEEVDDLVDAGDVDGAVALLESVVVSDLSTTPAADPRLAAALGDLAGLHASRGGTLRADELRARAAALRSRAAAPGALGDREPTEKCSSQEGAMGPKDSGVSADTEQNNEAEEDDWEAIADSGALDDTLVRSLEQEARVPSCSSSEKSSSTSSGPKRRGRGSFLYDKSVLYSDQCGSQRDSDDKESGPQSGSKDHVNEQENSAVTAAAQLGTRHVLVLYDFPPSTRTIDLERIFDKFGDHGVAIRWVNDTSALAVFRTPSAASEAQSCTPPRYKVRSLKENDDLLTKIDGRDLEPPKPRPKTSARTAQRLIAHGMGLKQFTNFGSDELKKQEEERKNRIAARQAMRDEAWGSD